MNSVYDKEPDISRVKSIADARATSVRQRGEVLEVRENSNWDKRHVKRATLVGPFTDVAKNQAMSVKILQR